MHNKREEYLVFGKQGVIYSFLFAKAHENYTKTTYLFLLPQIIKNG